MKLNAFKKHILCAVAALGLTVAAMPAMAATVDLLPSTAGEVTVGQTVSFELVTSADFPAVFGFSAALGYNADLLSFDTVTYGGVFDFTPLPINTPVEAPGATGQQSLGVFTAGVFFNALPSGTFTAATFAFTAVGAGVATVTVGPFGDTFFLDAFQEPVPLEPVSATVSVVADTEVPPVPLPASALLLLAGAASFGAIRRRGTRNAA